MKNPLIASLRAASKNGEFDPNGSVISYKTGIPVLDYFLGYNVNVFDITNDSIIETYSCIGIPAGCFVTFIGKPGSTKTTTAVQIAANIVRGFESGAVIHYDLEQAMNYSRIQALTKLPMSAMEDKYVLRQEKNSIDDIYEAVFKIYKEKTNNPELYKYKTGKLNEFGKEIELYQPTVVIIDSIASLCEGVNEDNKAELKKVEELEGNTYANRVARDISQFYTKLLPRVRTANIIVIAINQIKDKINIGVMPSASSMLYLKQDETLPGGKAPQFYAHILLKFIAIGSEKHNEEEDGFGGFDVTTDIIKARTNQSGISFSMVYDNVRGIDSERTSIKFAKKEGLISGNKNSMYFLSNKEDKFSLVDIHKSFNSNKELYQIMYSNIIPILESKLSTLGEEELVFNDNMLEY